MDRADTLEGVVTLTTSTSIPKEMICNKTIDEHVKLATQHAKAKKRKENEDNQVFLKACWCLARADGAFEIDRVSNDSIPEAFLRTGELGVYAHMQRQARRYFSLEQIGIGKLQYAPCWGFQKTGCTLDVDYVSKDTAYVVRGGMWISSSFDAAYVQGYAARERERRRETWWF